MKKTGLVDIHMHVIPYVDDGSDSFDESLKMLRIAYEEGITEIIATPHSGAFDILRPKVRKNFDRLREKADKTGIKVNLELGSEILIEPNNITQTVRRMRKGKYPTLAGGKYALVEFQLCEKDYGAISKCIDVITDNGFIPVIAHSEKYCFKIDQVYELRERGCLLQINYDDIIPLMNDPISKKANIMLNDEMVSFVATDAHRSFRRTPHISDAIDYLYDRYNSEYVDRIVFARDLF